MLSLRRRAGLLVAALGLLGTSGMIPVDVPLMDRGFVPVAREDGVTVYKLPGSEHITLAAEGRFAAPPDKVRKALLDYPDHVGRVPHLAFSRVLDRGPGWLLVYQRLVLSVISDRDFTLLVRWGADGDVLWTEFRVANHRGPGPQEGYVRMPVHTGSWQLKPILEGKATHARYQVTLDMGGMLPRWMANTSRDFGVPELFNTFRRALAESIQ